MKCPYCYQEMKSVDVEYTANPEEYVLNEESGKYQYVCHDDLDIDDDDYSLYCGECGKELEGVSLLEFQELIEL